MIREALALDAAAIGRVQVMTWRQTYQQIIETDTLSRLSESRATAQWLHWFFHHPPDQVCQVIADDRGRIQGYAMGGIARRSECAPAALSAESAIGTQTGRAEIQVLYLAPEIQGEGHGKALVKSMARRFDRLGMRSLEIWVLAQNPACQFYERLGGRLIDERNNRVGRQLLPELCYLWPSLKPLLRAAEITWPA